METKNLTDVIKKYRTDNLMSQEKFAKKLRVSVATVSKMEKPGAYKWTPLTVARLLKKLPGLLEEQPDEISRRKRTE
jgi:DNA-binding transcriptional regulator YiaG